MSNKAAKGRTNAPNRKDLSGDISGTGVQELLFKDFKLNAAQIEMLEYNGKIKLTDTLKEAIEKAIDDYISMSRWRKLSLQRGAIGKELADFKKRVDSLFEFFFNTPTSETSPRDAALQKIENELSDLCVMMTHPIEELNRRHFFSDLSSLKEATEDAVRKFEQDGAGDGGGKNADDAKNVFFKELDRIYKHAAGRKGAFEDFVLAVIQIMPETDRPEPPNLYASLSRRTVRARKK